MYLALTFTERSDDTAFEDAPKAFSGLSVNSTDDVLTFGMVNSRVREFHAKMFVANPLISADQAHLVRYGFVDKHFQRRGANILNHAGTDITLAANGTGH